MKQKKLILTLIAATLAGTALASQHENDGGSDKRIVDGSGQEQVVQNDAQIREHFIRVAELAGFEVLGTSNPDSVDVSEMVLTVRPQAQRVMWMSNHYNQSDYLSKKERGDRRHHDDD